MATLMRVLMLSLVLLLAAFGPILAVKPLITDHIPELIKQAGDDAEFKCTVEYGEDSPTARKEHHMVWTKFDTANNSQIISSGDTYIMVDDRISLATMRLREDTALIYIFEIQNIREADIGRYNCQLKDASNNSITSADINLSVTKQSAQRIFYPSTTTIG